MVNLVIKCHFTSRFPSHSARAFGGSQYCLVSIVSKEENKKPWESCAGPKKGIYFFARPPNPDAFSHMSPSVLPAAFKDDLPCSRAFRRPHLRVSPRAPRLSPAAASSGCLQPQRGPPPPPPSPPRGPPSPHRAAPYVTQHALNGWSVVLTGLKGRPELNGQTVTVGDFDATKERYFVETAVGEVILVKRTNMMDAVDDDDGVELDDVQFFAARVGADERPRREAEGARHPPREQPCRAPAKRSAGNAHMRRVCRCLPMPRARLRGGRRERAWQCAHRARDESHKSRRLRRGCGEPSLGRARQQQRGLHITGPRQR